jgi:uridylate kinase
MYKLVLKPEKPRGFGLDADKVAEITEEIADVHSLGVEVGVVVGGGNIFRGVAEQAKEMDRVSADNMGMLSTIINAIALQDASNSARCSAA